MLQPVMPPPMMTTFACSFIGARSLAKRLARDNSYFW